MRSGHEEKGMLPVGSIGVVEKKGQSFLLTSLVKLFNQIPARWRVEHIEIGGFRFKETKSIMVLGGDGDVLHSCFQGYMHR